MHTIWFKQDAQSEALSIQTDAGLSAAQWYWDKLATAFYMVSTRP